MRKLLLLLTLALAFTTTNASNAFNVTYESSGSKEIIVTFNLGKYKLIETEIDGQQFTRIAFDHSIATNKKGFAELPYLNASIQLENNNNLTLEIEGGKYVEYKLKSDLLPSRGIIYRDQNKEEVPYVVNPNSIKDEWYPQTLASATDPYILKDKRGINVYAYPFSYNAKRKVLRVYKSLKVKLVKNSTTPINPILNFANRVLPEMQPVYNSVFINNQQNARDNLTINQLGDILLICTARDSAAIKPYIKWKQEKGFNVEKQVVEKGTNVKGLIKEKYDANNNILYVVLVGDWEDLKSDKGPQNGPMDPQLGCVAGNDNVADIIVGRISANNVSDVSTQVSKFINYEQNPEKDASWYSAALGIASDEGGPSEGKGDDMEADTTHQRVILDDKLAPFSFSKLYTAFDPGANVSDVKAAVEEGVSIINYSGHGDMSSWVSSNFSSSSVNNLNNGSKLPVVISVACNNGDFHKGTCFAESWLRKKDGGAVSMLAASISQPWDEPMRGQDYIADLIIGGYNYDDHDGQNGISTTEQRSILGSIVFNAFVLMTSESNGTSDWETVKTWNIFGDPSLQIRTKAPSELILTNNTIISGIPFETIVLSDGKPVKGAQVCISGNNKYYSGITDENGRISIDHQLFPGAAKLVVSSFNTLTKYEDVNVISPDGAYVVVTDYNINDESENNNGQLDYKETVLLDVSAKNVGTDTAFNVNATLYSTDLQVSINDNAHQYFTMVSNTTIQGNSAFSFTLSDGVPDQHAIELEVEFEDESNEKWKSSVFITANAPKFSIGEISIDDSSEGNNDGILDAGETVDIKIQIENIGHSTSVVGITNILSSSTNLVINNSTFELQEIAPNEKQTVIFNITANTDVDLETPANFTCNVEAGKYNTEKNLSILIGKIPIYTMKNGVFEVGIGRFMDSGSQENEYQLNENYTITFKPLIAGDTVVLDFTSFNIEAGYDFMYIYDGLNSSANQIGDKYSGSTSPGKIQANNPDGAITVKFTSDDYITAPGWVADVSCIEGPTAIRNNVSKKDFIFYPNPATNSININIENKSTITIYDLTGRIIVSKQLNSGIQNVDVSSLQTGNYVIELTNSNVSIAKKLLIH